jgi:hypothetical protein
MRDGVSSAGDEWLWLTRVKSHSIRPDYLVFFTFLRQICEG